MLQFIKNWQQRRAAEKARRQIEHQKALEAYEAQITSACKKLGGDSCSVYVRIRERDGRKTPIEGAIIDLLLRHGVLVPWLTKEMESAVNEGSSLPFEAGVRVLIGVAWDAEEKRYDESGSWICHNYRHDFRIVERSEQGGLKIVAAGFVNSGYDLKSHAIALVEAAAAKL